MLYHCSIFKFLKNSFSVFCPHAFNSSLSLSPTFNNLSPTLIDRKLILSSPTLSLLPIWPYFLPTIINFPITPNNKSFQEGPSVKNGWGEENAITKQEVSLITEREKISKSPYNNHFCHALNQHAWIRWGILIYLKMPWVQISNSDISVLIVLYYTMPYTRYIRTNWNTCIEKITNYIFLLFRTR